MKKETYMKFREKALARRRKKEINPRNLLKIKPFDWGPGTERTSKEIDEIL